MDIYKIDMTASSWFKIDVNLLSKQSHDRKTEKLMITGNFGRNLDFKAEDPLKSAKITYFDPWRETDFSFSEIVY